MFSNVGGKKDIVTQLLGNTTTEVASEDATENLSSFSLQNCNQSRVAGNHQWAEAPPIISTFHSSEEVLAQSWSFLMTLMAKELYDRSNPGSGSVSGELKEMTVKGWGLESLYSHK